MENFNVIIAENLKRIRDEKKLSLDNVAKMSGVSKSMLGQIERGEANPTITTVWKIANGLKISFTSLMSRPESDIEIVKKQDRDTICEDNGRFKNHPIFPFEEHRRFEVYSIDIEKGGYLSSEAHPQGTQEFITIYGGEVTIRVNDEEYVLCDGESIRFKADVAHSYHNSGNLEARVSMVIYYPQ